MLKIILELLIFSYKRLQQLMNIKKKQLFAEIEYTILIVLFVYLAE